MYRRYLRKWYHHWIVRQQLKNIQPHIIGSATVNSAHQNIFNPNEPEFIQNPYPMLQYLREYQPLHRAQSGAWVLSRYNDIVNALGDERLGNAPSEYAVIHNKNRHHYCCADVANNILPFMDPPQHSIPRAVISRKFHQFVRDNPPDYSNLAKQLADDLQQRPQFDLLHDFATPYSLKVFARIMGIPQQDLDKLEQWSQWFFYLFTMIPSEEIRNKLDRVLIEFRQYLEQQIKLQIEQKQSSLLTALVQCDKTAEKLSMQQIIDNCMLLFADGIENVDKAIASSFLLLKQHPEQLQQLKQQPELLDSAIDECLRFESPAQFIGRVAREDIEMHGHIIRKNEAVLLLLASANRDETRFSEADKFDIARHPNAHISFGKSRHGCIGGPLVEKELKHVIPVLLDFIEEVEIDSSGLQWAARSGHRWLQLCPLKRH